MTRERFGLIARRGFWLPAALSALAAFAFFKEFGVGWDDPFQMQYGDMLVSYYASGGTDQRFAELADLRFYGGAFELPVQFLSQYSPWTEVETRRLAGALAGALGVLGGAALGGLVAGAGGAWLAGVLLATWPVWLGHSFINSKDVPFATAFVWAVYCLVRIVQKRDQTQPRDHIGFAISSGLASGTRAGGLILLVVYALVLLRAVVATARERGENRLRRAARLTGLFATGAAVSWGLMLLSWPWTHEAPFARPFEAAELMTRFPRPMEVLFNGKLIVTTRLPWDYAPTWLLATLPPLVVVLLFLAVPLSLIHLRRGSRPGAPLFILLLLASGPIAATMIGRLVLYDGIRQLLFIVPPLIAIAAWAGVTLFAELGSSRSRGLAVLVALVFCLDPLTGLVRLHPYQYIYFNRFVGGLKGIEGRFETDYWGLALRETAEWVNRNRSLLKSRGVLKVFVPHNCAEPTSAGEYLDPAIRLTDNNMAADFVLAPTRFGCDRRFDGTSVFRVERQGVTLAVVKVME
jgi:hypothetical protein